MLRGFDVHQAFTETAGQSTKQSIAETIISLQNTIKKLEIQRKYQNKLLTLHLQRVPEPMQGDCEAIFLESVYCKTPFETVTKHPPTNLFESLGYSMNTLDRYKARISKIQEKLTHAEHERQQMQKEYEHYTRDYLRFVSQHLVSDRFAPLAPQECRNQQPYARAFMAQVIEDPDNEANAPTPRASASTTDPVNVTATSNVTVPFVPGDGSASSITAPADEQLPVPTTPTRTPAPGFGLPPLSASRASEIMLELQNRANEARLANNLSLASGGGITAIPESATLKNDDEDSSTYHDVTDILESATASVPEEAFLPGSISTIDLLQWLKRENPEVYSKFHKDVLPPKATPAMPRKPPVNNIQTTMHTAFPNSVRTQVDLSSALEPLLQTYDLLDDETKKEIWLSA